jgi:hypothetical protein
MGPGGKVILALQDPMGNIIVYTGTTKEVDLRLDYPIDEIQYLPGHPMFRVPTGSPTLSVQLEMHLTYQGEDMKTWADIRSPVGEISNRREIE